LLVALADGEVNLQGDPGKPSEWIQRQPGASLTFCTAHGQLFRPLYELRAEHYTTYCRLASGIYDGAK
jgi:hypothetical protein